jgi:omega-6 fatty acid desaturase (delta-12 desaturase)
VTTEAAVGGYDSPYLPEIPDAESPALAGNTDVASGPREGNALIVASRPFAQEQLRRSAWETFTTFTVLALTMSAAAAPVLPTAARALFSIIAGLTVVRGFILYHDALHGAMYRGNSLFARVMRGVMWLYGLFVLAPPSVWRATHNYHHANTAKLVGSHIGSYPTMTVEMYRRAKPWQKRLYRAVRNPLTMLFGYLTVFLWGMCIGPFVRDRKRHWDAAPALLAHVALSAAMISTVGALTWALVVLVPLMTACAAGSYLFYAQHNFPGIMIQPRDKWSYTRAALESSSMMVTGPIMGWFTGQIGYHHVHHLNPGIPFYRLAEAMAAIPELQNPHTTTLNPKDIMACLRLGLWDMRQKKMVPYAEAEAN